jgi:DNA-directed RNA polymerase subunit RPC12/RpoP
MIGFLAKVFVAIFVFVLFMRLGMFMVGGLARPHPPPEPGLLRRVNLRYRCSICLAEVKMVQATEELPPAPRHCQEEMDLIAPPFE